MSSIHLIGLPLIIAVYLGNQGFAVHTKDFMIGILLDESLNRKSISRALDATLGPNHEYVEGFSLTLKWIVLNSKSHTNISKTVCRVINDGIQAVVSVLRCPQRRTVSTMTETHRIPHLSVDLDKCPQRDLEDFSLSFPPQYENLASTLSDIVKAVGCKEVAFIFGDTFANSVRVHILTQFSTMGIRFVLIDFPPTTNISWIPQHIIAVISFDNLQMLAESRYESILFKDYKVWVHLIDNLSTEDLGRLVYRYRLFSNLVFLQAKPMSMCEAIGPSYSTSTTKLTPFEHRLATAVLALHKAFGKAATCHSFGDKKAQCSTNLQGFSTIGTEIMKQLLKICGMGSSNTSNICSTLSARIEYELFVINPHGQAIVIANWTDERGINILYTLPNVTNGLFAKTVADFGGVSLVIAVDADSRPLVSRDVSGNRTYQGLIIDMLEDLSAVLNFSYVLVESPDNLYGIRLPNDSWTGMIGMVIRGEADMAASTITVTPERGKFVDFTTSFMRDSLGILTPKPRESVDFFQVFKTFSPWVWMSLMGFMLLTIVFIFRINVSIYKHADRRNQDEVTRLSFQQTVVLIVSAFCQQGPTFHPSAVSARCFLTFWFVFTLLIMTMYTAHLAAVLTVTTPVKPINSLKDLVDRTDLAEGRGCFIGDRTYLEYEMARQCGKTRLADEAFHSFSMAFVLAKNSPYKHAINAKIQKMVESGHIEGWRKKWVNAPANCRHSSQNYSSEAIILGLDRIGGIMILYGGVALIGAILLLLEVLYHRIAKSRTFKMRCIE